MITAAGLTVSRLRARAVNVPLERPVQTSAAVGGRNNSSLYEPVIDQPITKVTSYYHSAY